MNADEKTFVKGLILGMRMRAEKERGGGRLEYADGMKYVIDEFEGIFFGKDGIPTTLLKKEN